MSIKVIYNTTQEIKGIEFTTFPGGEESVRLPNLPLHQNGFIEIKVNLRTSQDVMRLLLVHEAVMEAYRPKAIHLTMPYIPYARQDRRCVNGEAFSLKVFCKLINSMKFDRVHVVDSHSSVATALLDNVEEICVDELLADTILSEYLDLPNAVLVSPDAGSSKKIQTISERFEASKVVRADKVRDCHTGAITGTVVYCDSLVGKDCIIVDDICDGGRTFLELGKALKAKGASTVTLFVSHGIFSQGFEKLDEYIDYYYTTDSFYNQGEKDNLTIINL